LSNASIALFPASIGDDLRKVPFVESVDLVRGRSVTYGDALIDVGSGDFRVAMEHGNLPMIEPRHERDGLARALRENGVFVSESFSLKYGKRPGDTIAIPTARGIARFPIAGVYRDYSSDRGVVVMDRALFIREFRDDAVNTAVVYLKPGVDRERARVALETQFGPKYHAFAVTNAAIRAEVMRIFDQTFLITYALLGIAIIVAVLGIVNTLAALILERTRELAVLRVLGTSAGELRTMIVLESTLLGVASTVVGLVMGYVLSTILIYVINKQSFGWTIEFHTPVALIAGSRAVTLFAAATAGLLPSRLARRIDLAAALKSE
jgi:putative ABC transport system permease protein